jgi:hypothetical protein
MKLRQLSVFMENRKGRLAEVTRILGDSGINIRALALADTSDFGILRLLVDRTDPAIEALSKAGFTVRGTEVVAVEVSDRPSGLSTVLALLQGAGINVEYMYAFLERRCDSAILVFRFEETERAIEALHEANIKVFTADEIEHL